MSSSTEFKKPKNRVAHQETAKSASTDRVYVFRLGNIHKSNATLVDNDYNVVEIPTYLLPSGSKPGSVIKMSLTRDEEQQHRREAEVERICSKVIKGVEGNKTNQVLTEE